MTTTTEAQAQAEARREAQAQAESRREAQAETRREAQAETRREAQAQAQARREARIASATEARRDDAEARCGPVRAKALARVRAALQGDEEEELAGRLERAIWNWTLRGFPPRDRYWDNARLRFRYTTKILSVCFNVRHPKNPGLRASVLRGETTPARLVRMTPYELFPEHWVEVFDRVAHKQLRKQSTLDVETAPDGLLQCRKCKSKKTTYTQLQTRSADEPLTTFALCLACGTRWKE